MTPRRLLSGCFPRWLITAGVLLLHGCHPCPASESVNLSWDPSPSPEVVGFNIYYGSAPGNYTNMISAGNVTNTIVSGLVAGVTYYFAATATDDIGQESDYSDEVSYTPLNTTPVTSPPPGAVKSNCVVTVFASVASAESLAGPWQTNCAVIYQATNPPAQSQFWRQCGLSIVSTNF